MGKAHLQVLEQSNPWNCSLLCAHWDYRDQNSLLNFWFCLSSGWRARSSELCPLGLCYCSYRWLPQSTGLGAQVLIHSAPFSVASEKTNWDQISWITASCRSLSKCSEFYLERAWFFFSLLYCAYLGLFQNLSSRRKKNICSLIFSLAIFRSLGLSGPFSAAPFYSMDVFVKDSLCLVRVIILASTSPLTGKNVCFSCHFVTAWLLPLQKWKDTLAQDPFCT